MKFIISRTSLYNDDKPCEEAFLEKYTRIEIRTLNSFEEFDNKFGKSEGTWLSKGINHCINSEGYIQREFPNANEDWFIELNTLEDLIKFQRKYGDIVLQEAYNNKNFMELEIYNDYRE